MPTSSTPPRTPLDDARAAFDPLSTTDKTAFVLQAAFDTVGQAIAETGRAFADVVQRFDPEAWARAAAPPADPRPAPEPPRAAPPRPPKPEA